jgi:hypothetical protein
VRHLIYLAYVLTDVGYNLTELAPGSVLVMLVGWASLVYRIHAEERILSQERGMNGLLCLRALPAHPAALVGNVSPGEKRCYMSGEIISTRLDIAGSRAHAAESGADRNVDPIEE